MFSLVSRSKFTVILFCLLIDSRLFAGGNQVAVSDFRISQPTSYLGVVNHSNTRNSDWFLNMFPDQTFNYAVMRMDNGDQAETEFGLGRWAVDEQRGLIVLDQGKQKPLFFQLSINADLLWADPDQPDHKGTLERSGLFSYIDLNGLMLSGMMTYMADAASIRLCQTGLTYPIDPVEDYLALERDYLENVSAPAEELMVLIEGRLAMRVPMEGEVRQMVVVDRFVRSQNNHNCSGELTMPSLANTYWRLDYIFERQIIKDKFSRVEPHMLFDLGAAATYSINVGCNKMQGALAHTDATLTFSKPLSTRMACPEPLDEYETLITQAVDEVVRYEISDGFLTLFDQNGGAVVRLSKQ